MRRNNFTFDAEYILLKDKVLQREDDKNVRFRSAVTYTHTPSQMIRVALNVAF